MIITLFGGAALIAVLYFALRMAGVSNYWRGVISGALPTMAIMSYSLIHWPGADVMALHIALYVATATVLTLTGGERRPKGQPFKFHWIPMGFVGFFMTLAVLMATFASIAFNGLPIAVAQQFMPNAASKQVHTAFSGVVPHDEDAAKAVSQYLSMAARQKQLGWRAEVDGLDQLKLNRAGDVTVSVKDGAQQPLADAIVKLSIKRPADIADTSKTTILAAIAPGRYRAQVGIDRPGQLVAVLMIERGQDKFETAKEIIIPAY